MDHLTHPYNMVAIVGPTASGKTARAVKIAEALDGEVISGDSRQLYRGMTLGTGKDLEEYGSIPYHLIDVADAGQRWNLHKYLTEYRKAESDIRRRNRIPILCGGSGMYVESVLAGVRLPEVPENPDLRNELKEKSLQELTKILSGMKKLHNITDVDTAARAIRAIEIELYYQEHPQAAANADRATSLPENALVIGTAIDREARRRRITERLQARLNAGMVDEIKSLLSAGLSPDDLIYYGLEYKYITLYVTGQLSYHDMIKSLEIAIHQFAKRQMTWFRGMEKRGIPIHWLPFDLTAEDFTASVLELWKVRR